MFNMDDEVCTALKADTTLTALAGGRIYHNGVKDGGKYPSVWYGENSNVPALFADDTEIYSRSTYAVSILSMDGVVKDIAKAIEAVMLGLGFRRFSYADLNDGTIRIKSMRFVIAGEDD